MPKNLIAEIQHLRANLHKLVTLAEDDLQAKEVLEASKQLDKLLVKYERSKTTKLHQ